MKLFCEDTMLTAASTVISNLESLRSRTDRMSVVSFLRELANSSEKHCENGPSRYDEFDASSRKATVRSRAHLTSLGGFLCKVTGENPTGRTFPFLRDLVLEYSSYLDLAAKILSRVVRECPQWFSDLPILTVFWITLFFVYTEVSWIQDCLPYLPQEELQKMLRRQGGVNYKKHMNLFNYSFVSLFTDFHYEMETYCNDGIPQRRGSVEKLPQPVKQCFNHSVQLITGIDKIFGYHVYRNEESIQEVGMGWEHDVKLTEEGKC